MIRALIALLVVGSCSILQASPLVYFALEGRTLGSNDAFSSNVEVELGDLVEYRLQLQMAPSGTVNSHIIFGEQIAGKHGVNSLSVSLLQDLTDPIQIDLTSPAELLGDSAPGIQDGWHRGIGARGGMPSPRLGSALNDLLDIRPIRGPGVFAGSQNTVFAGAFKVAALSGEIGHHMGSVVRFCPARWSSGIADSGERTWT